MRAQLATAHHHGDLSFYKPDQRSLLHLIAISSYLPACNPVHVSRSPTGHMHDFIGKPKLQLFKNLGKLPGYTQYPKLHATPCFSRVSEVANACRVPYCTYASVYMCTATSQREHSCFSHILEQATRWKYGDWGCRIFGRLVMLQEGSSAALLKTSDAQQALLALFVTCAPDSHPVVASNAALAHHSMTWYRVNDKLDKLDFAAPTSQSTGAAAQEARTFCELLLIKSMEVSPGRLVSRLDTLESIAVSAQTNLFPAALHRNSICT